MEGMEEGVSKTKKYPLTPKEIKRILKDSGV